jgi:hypothetical protein
MNKQEGWRKEVAEMMDNIERQKELLDKMEALHKKWSALHPDNCECKKEENK